MSVCGGATNIEKRHLSVGKVLFVVHGPGRGRPGPTGKAFLERLTVADPDLASRIFVHRTGEDAPSLQGVSLVVFWLSDPLQAKHPHCYEEAVCIATEASARDIPVLNQPTSLNNTSKSKQSELWQAAGLPCAKSEPVANKCQLEIGLKRLGTPCIFRTDDEHAQRGVRVIDRQEQLREICLEGHPPGVLLQAFDVRQAYRNAGTDPKSPFARFHHKARAFVVRDEVKHSHIVFSESMIVGVSNCTFQRRGTKLSGIRTSLYRALNDVAAQVREDVHYFNSKPLAANMLVDSVKTLGLDFAAVDYAIYPDGNVILWEANPYFYLPPGSQSVMPNERDAVRRVEESFDWMGQCLRAISSQNASCEIRKIVR